MDEEMHRHIVRHKLADSHVFAEALTLIWFKMPPNLCVIQMIPDSSRVIKLTRPVWDYNPIEENSRELLRRHFRKETNYLQVRQKNVFFTVVSVSVFGYGSVCVLAVYTRALRCVQHLQLKCRVPYRDREGWWHPTWLVRPPKGKRNEFTVQ